MKKKTSRKRKATNRSCAEPAGSDDFWVIDTDSEGCSAGTLTAHGPYPDQAAAEKWLRDDAREVFLDADRSCRQLSNTKWAGRQHIVRVIRTVEQCPVVTVKVHLRDAPNNIVSQRAESPPTEPCA